MAGFTDSTEQAMLDYFVANYAATTKYLGLSTTPPGESGSNFTEPGSGAYARVATTAVDWAAASGSSPAQKANSVVKTFPTATADWASGANFGYWGLFTLALGGTLLAFGLLAVPKSVLIGDTASFPAGALILELGDPTDIF